MDITGITITLCSWGAAFFLLLWHLLTAKSNTNVKRKSNK